MLEKIYSTLYCSWVKSWYEQISSSETEDIFWTKKKIVIILKDQLLSKEIYDIISALKVEDDNELLEEISDLKKTLTDVNVSVEDKNKAFEKLKNINQNSSVEEKIENKIKEKYNKECFVKIDNDQIRIVIGSNDHSTELANEIMRLVQEEFDKKMYISVQFQN